jgi:hypothetical protein
MNPVANHLERNMAQNEFPREVYVWRIDGHFLIAERINEVPVYEGDHVAVYELRMVGTIKTLQTETN